MSRLQAAIIAVTLVLILCVLSVLVVVAHDAQQQQARYENQKAKIVPYP